MYNSLIMSHEMPSGGAETSTLRTEIIQWKSGQGLSMITKDGDKIKSVLAFGVEPEGTINLRAGEYQNGIFIETNPTPEEMVDFVEKANSHFPDSPHSRRLGNHVAQRLEQEEQTINGLQSRVMSAMGMTPYAIIAED